MEQDFSDEQMRVELKRIVEDFHAAMVSKLQDVVYEAEGTEGVTDQQVREVRDKIAGSKAVLSHRVQQLMNFIDRQ